MKRLLMAFLVCFVAFYAWAQSAQGEGTALLDDLDSKSRVVVDAFANASNKIHSLIQSVSPKPDMEGYLKSTNFNTTEQDSEHPRMGFVGKFTFGGVETRLPISVMRNDWLVQEGAPTNSYGVVSADAEQLVDFAKRHSEKFWWNRFTDSMGVWFEEVTVSEWDEEQEQYDEEGNYIGTETVHHKDYYTNDVWVADLKVDLRSWVLSVIDKHSPTNLHPDIIKFLNQKDRYDVYVSDAVGDDSNTGASPFAPKKSVQGAIDYAVSNDIYSVCVASGTYAFPVGYGNDTQGYDQSLPRRMMFKSVDGAENTIMSYEKTVEIYGDSARCSIKGYNEQLNNMIWDGFTFYGLTMKYGRNSRETISCGWMKDCVIRGIRFTGQRCTYLKLLFGNIIFERCKFYDNQMEFDGYGSPLRAGCLFRFCYFSECDIRVAQGEFVRKSEGWISLLNMCDIEDSIVVVDSDAINALITNTYSSFDAVVMNNIMLFKGGTLSGGAFAYNNYFYNNNLIGNGEGGNIRDIVANAKESKWIDYDTAYAFFTNGGTSKDEVGAFGYGDKIRSSVRIWLDSLPIMRANSVTIQDDANNKAFMLVKNDGGVLKLYEVVDNTVSGGSFASVGLLGIGSAPPPVDTEYVAKNKNGLDWQFLPPPEGEED